MKKKPARTNKKSAKKPQSERKNLPSSSKNSAPDALVDCDVCGTELDDIHCKLQCPMCGTTRDCSDP